MLDVAVKREIKSFLSTSQMWHLCERLQEKENNRNKDINLENLERAVTYAVEKIQTIQNVLPEFTLHNLQHSCNVLNIMEKLLYDMKIIEDEKVEISSYEVALLILAAFFHDIGMCLPEENYDVTQESEYSTFARGKEYLDKDDLRKKYIRECHHLRVRIFIDDYNEKCAPGFEWIEKNGNRQTFLELERICSSHNEGKETLEKLDNTLHQDEKFCAIILRLADILDLDNTRTPINEMENIKFDEIPESWYEWKKHFSSEGIKFDSNGLLKLTGHVVKEPRVYQRLNLMVKLINIELDLCREVLPGTSVPYRDRRLPQKAKNKVDAKGFELGKYSYEIEKKDVMNLFMGENLYMDKMIFIRELLQNSIDASIYYKKILEKESRKIGFIGGEIKTEPVTVHVWKDEVDSISFLIEDGGVGMNKEVIMNYFLKIGKSFFKSDTFKHSGIDFMPISRFGVGFLSAFLVTNEIVVITKHHEENGIMRQLTLNMDVDDYILRESNENKNKYDVHKQIMDWNGNMVDMERMLNEKHCGTLIYFQIKEELINVDMDRFVDSINKYLFIAPVDVNCDIDGTKIIRGGGFQKQFMKFISLPLEKEGICRAIHKNTKGFKDDEEIVFESLPIVIEYSDDYGKVDGKLQVLTVYDTKQRHATYKFSYNLNYENDSIHIRIGNYQRAVHDIELNSEYSKLGISNKVKIYFNGISHLSTADNEQMDTIAPGFFSGYLLLEGKFRPDVGVARSGNGRLDLETMACINYQYWKQLQDYVKNDNHKRNAYFSLQQPDVLINLDNILYTDYELHDKVIQNYDWNELSLIQTERGFLSVNEIQEHFHDNTMEIELLEDITLNKTPDFRTLLVAYLIKHNFDIVIKISEEMERIFIRNGEDTVHDDYSLPPLFFVEYENVEILKYGNYPLNRKHWFSKWLIDICKAESFKENKNFLVRNFQRNFADGKLKREGLLKNINTVLSKYMETELDSKDITIYKTIDKDLRAWLEVH